ncbi:MAG: phenylalanyl-tRNA synthetase subunit beta, phenylalanyl-tRNA synthetase beta chain [Parcubacteria group bacterium]|nr:phenylalanyl-tRNA synthetase subunit beta, phenylalanyl-tRNA synthetase beta chain [Parcubacteria group bacterium]
MYRIGISQGEIDEAKLRESGLSFTVVEPRQKILDSARSAVGKPYKRGASVLKDAPNCFECSSLVAWAAVESGYSIPRVSVDQFVFSKRINKEDLLPGDLVFANTEEIVHTEGAYYSQVLKKEVKEEPIRYETLEYMPGTKVPHGVDHVGIYMGNNKIIHGTSSKNAVVEEDLDTSASFQKIVGYGRIVEDDTLRFVIEIPDDRPDLRNKENLLKEVQK